MISVVVPIFNEEEIVNSFHTALADSMKDIGEAWEVVYINDGSRDSSLKLLTELQTKDTHVVVVDLSRNWGHMGAMSAGLQTAHGDAVVLMDGDFQDPPEVVPELVAAWRGGAQVVTAVRRSPSKNGARFWPSCFPSSIACWERSPTFPSRSMPGFSACSIGKRWIQLTPCGKAAVTCLACAPGWATRPASCSTIGRIVPVAKANSRS